PGDVAPAEPPPPPPPPAGPDASAPPPAPAADSTAGAVEGELERDAAGESEIAPGVDPGDPRLREFDGGEPST
ncbi:MAG: hypothetical protein HY719_18060, partial [Planctomycetes bacterium]|nr:hypothetical protein [Planctomycetota bacterium]